MHTFRTLPTVLALGALFAGFVTQAQAADVRIYGRIDTGIAYQHFGGDSVKDDSLTMENGTNTKSRWGIEGSEPLNDDVTVGFRLENRFNSDTGELRGDRMFEGNASVKVVSKTYGEIALGRISGLSSSSGPYDHQGFIDPFGGGTFGMATQPVMSSRMDNMITYRSPMMAGLQVTAQHSLKMNNPDEGEESSSDANRFWAGALHYANGPLHLVAAFEETTWGHMSSGGATTDRKVLTLGGSYKLSETTLYAQAQYFDGVEALDGFTGLSKDHNAIKGGGLYLGAEFWFGAHSWKNMVYYRDYTVKSDLGKNVDATSIGLGSKFVYRPSKTVELYAGGSLSQWDRYNDAKNGTLTDKGLSLYSGVTKYF